ncbi:MAG: hypothetical protein ACJATN_000440 [Neolewinella sp.]
MQLTRFDVRLNLRGRELNSPVESFAGNDSEDRLVASGRAMKSGEIGCADVEKFARRLGRETGEFSAFRR